MNGFELVRLQPEQVVKTGDTITGNLTAQGNAKFVGPLQGNADTTTRLQTARTINGTSFNGTANITTANWGTSRNITIGEATKPINGSGNVTYTLNEMKAVRFHYDDGVTTPGGNDRVPGIKADNQEWFHTPSGGILPLRDGQGYVGHSTRKFYDVCTNFINAHHVGGNGNNLRWDIIPVVGNNGVMEIGRYIDFHVLKSSTVDYGFRIDNNANGSAVHHGTWSQFSDKKLKENINYIDKSTTLNLNKKDNEFVDFIKNMQFATFNYKGAENDTFGFIAQDVAKYSISDYFLKDIETKAVDEKDADKDGMTTYKAFDTMAYTSVIAKALQEEILLREKLTTELQETMKKVSELEKEIEALKVQP